jgi:ribosomal protein S20
MPNIKSAAKRDQLAKVRYAKNKALRSTLRTTLKKFDTAVTEGERDTAVSAYKVAVKSVDRAVSKGLIHKNNAAHKKSKMTIKLNALAQ